MTHDPQLASQRAMIGRTLALNAMAALTALLAFPVTAADVARGPNQVDQLLGRDARGLEQLLGAPRQDVREGPGRRLQFSSTACILDVYLYPPDTGGDAVAVYLSARVPDGRDAERNSCITALRAAR